ncbi:type IV secretion system DNA-binding domain-containing protein [Spirosoma sp. BT702]|uniref:Type IV secretion system DNA-binding domain-containing protein n=1 Tax=Spirosoma profusum TaxID=2771354 RepID=A0A926XYM4_9BACT|nr:YWFCY domain-containing protein [Spirosoma profusum]MBD2703369.1 type IV secretion system DNA-binding domain-containing protein [Spirosoma profusum]
MREDRKPLNNNLEMFLWAGLACLGLHLYVELNLFFASFGIESPITNNMLSKTTQNSSVFTTPWTLKLFGGGLIAAYGTANRGVKSMTLTCSSVFRTIVLGLVLFVGSTLILRENSLIFLRFLSVNSLSVVYLVLTIAGMLYLIKGTQGINRLLHSSLGKDRFNRINETFPQEEQLLANTYSVNIPTEYEFEGKRKGWLNISATFRALLLMGSPGSGKTYGVIHSVIRQHIEKGLSMYVYDFKYPSLTMVAYNALIRHQKKLPKKLKFYCINFDDPRKSHRSNPLHPSYLPSISHAVETSRMMLMNLNRKWIDRQGEYFVESPINYVAALIWYLRTYDQGQYCTFPHLIELATRNYREIIPILMNHPDLAILTIPFASAAQGGAVDQLEGQISTAQIALARVASPALYWTMSAHDFSLEINDPQEPKILCLGNNQTVKDTYGAALGLYNYRIMSLINKSGQHPSSLVVDELPTIYFKGIGELIQTARSNRVAVTIGMQDFSQLEKDYGSKEAESIKNTCGNIISGQVFDKTAEAMQNRIGKSVQRKENINIQSEDTTHGFSTELNWMVPAAKMAQLSQGWFAGVLSDNVGQESDKKAFHARLAIDVADFEKEQKVKELPDFSIFVQQSLEDRVRENYKQIKADINGLVESELTRLEKKVNKAPGRPKLGDDPGKPKTGDE